MDCPASITGPSVPATTSQRRLRPTKCANIAPLTFERYEVQAFLAHRKTQHRIAFDPQPPSTAKSVQLLSAGNFWRHPRQRGRGGSFRTLARPGDLFWVRESWMDAFARTDDNNGCVYLADYGRNLDLISYEQALQAWRWRTPMTMRRWASRITLRVDSVAQERIRDIDVSGAIAEGIAPTWADWGLAPPQWAVRSITSGRGEPDPRRYDERTPAENFLLAWDAKHKAGLRTDINPMAWVIRSTVHLANIDSHLRQEGSSRE